MKNKGFTLIEMLVVIAIIGIIFAVIAGPKKPVTNQVTGEDIRPAVAYSPSCQGK